MMCMYEREYKIIRKREISFNEGEAYAKEQGMEFFEVSAKTGEGVSEMFNSIYSRIISLLNSGSETAQVYF